MGERVEPNLDSISSPPTSLVKGETGPQGVSGKAKVPWATPGPCRRGLVGSRKPWRVESSGSSLGLQEAGSDSGHSKRPSTLATAGLPREEPGEGPQD